MIVAIDTSSLVTLVRYYLPFDTNGILYEFVKRKVESGYIRIIDKVFEECQYTSKGIVIDALDYIKKHQIRTTDILPNRKFFNQLEYNFINGSAKNKLTSIEFEARKDAYLESADAKLLLYCLKHTHEQVGIISEETETSNDNKSFKKLPAICKFVNLDIRTLPELIEAYQGIDLEFK